MTADGVPAEDDVSGSNEDRAAPLMENAVSCSVLHESELDEPAQQDNGNDRERLTIAGHLIEYALARYSFIRDTNGDIYALPKMGAGTIAIPLDELRYPLAAQYFSDSGKPASTSAWPEAAQTLKGLQRDAPRRQVHLRHAFHDGVVIVDLGREDAAVVVVSETGWEITERSPAIFRRTADMAEMPLPVHGSSLELIRARWHIPHARWGLILGWLVIALLPNLPAPVLALLGEQGTGKSLLMKLLVMLVDPGAPIGRPPASEERLQNAVVNHRVYGIDNLSHIQPWFSDALAALVTGESDKRRKLYTDAEPFRLNLKAAVVLTGITIEGAGPDLLERMVSINLDVIRGGERLHEARLWEELDRQLPGFLGALFDLVPPVLEALAAEQPPYDLPRMADYGLVLDALDRVAPTPDGTTGFYRFYTAEMPQFTAEEVIEGSEFAADFISWFNERDRRAWMGTAAELLQEVAAKRFDSSPGGAPKIPKSADYPRTPRGVSGALKRLAPVLRTLHIAWTPPRPGGSHNSRVHMIAPTMPAVDVAVSASRISPSRPETDTATAPIAPNVTAADAPAARSPNRTGLFDDNVCDGPPFNTNSPIAGAPAYPDATDPDGERAFGAVLLQQPTPSPTNDDPVEIDAGEIERLANLSAFYQRLDRHDEEPRDHAAH
jgi:hypothetical protein